MKIGIIGAMQLEVALLKKEMTISQHVKKARMDFFVGRLGTNEVVLVPSGIGKVNAAVCAQILLDDFRVTHIINTGVAGALNKELDIGDIVVSVDTVQHDFDVESIGYKKGEIPFTGLVAFKADGSLRKKALEAVRTVLPEINVVEGRICSGDQFISSNEVKQRIIADFVGDCTEMEGAAIAQVCWMNNVPFVILRAISDKADDSSHIRFEEFEKKAAVNSAKVVLHMLTV